jgi:hypothetical protein
MKKFVPILVVLVLVLSVIGIAKGGVWASPAPAGVNAPLRTLIDITANGTYNIGGVCDVTVNFLTTGNDLKADSEVPVDQSKPVPFSGDGHLLYPGCHFVFSKGGTVVNQTNATDLTTKVCFGASAELQMGIYYYLDTPATGRVWTLLPTTMEDSGRLVCAPANYTGVYMPTGKVVPPPGAEKAGANAFFPNGAGGTVLPPPSDVTITASGTYAVGGICLIKDKYNITGLSDTVQVEYPKDQKNHYTEDTRTIPFADFSSGEVFYYPGCHIIHYKDLKPQDQMNKTNADGTWQICFAAIPGKTMTIYYYDDNLTTMVAPWNPLVTTTLNGMSCADTADFSAVYALAAK